MEKTIEVDYYTAIKHMGKYNGISYEISENSFREKNDELSRFLCSSNWYTYVILSEEQHDAFKDRINDAPWNGGQTYYRKITEDRVDAGDEFNKKYSKPFYKIGDDFAHSWDNERYDMYDVEYMRKHIMGVIDYLVGEKQEE